MTALQYLERLTTLVKNEGSTNEFIDLYYLQFGRTPTQKAIEDFQIMREGEQQQEEISYPVESSYESSYSY